MAWRQIRGSEAVILVPTAFCCLVQADKADLGTQGWGFPGQQLDEEGSEGRRGPREGAECE